MRLLPGRAVWVALATLIAVLGLAAPAAAHTDLAESTPSPDTLVHQQPGRVSLSFTEPLSPTLVQVAVTAPDGKDVVMGRPLVSGGTVTAKLPRLDAPGTYRVAYRVMAEDNHPVTGEFGFRVSREVASTSVDRPVTDPQVQRASLLAAEPASSASGISGAWVALALAAAGLLLSAVISRSTARRRRVAGH